MLVGPIAWLWGLAGGLSLTPRTHLPVEPPRRGPGAGEPTAAELQSFHAAYVKALQELYNSHETRERKLEVL